MTQEDIWNNIAKADKLRQAIIEIGEKEKQIQNLQITCGSCNLWMTSQCKREVTKKVSSSMPTCNDFNQANWVTTLIEKLKAEITLLKESRCRVH